MLSHIISCWFSTFIRHQRKVGKLARDQFDFMEVHKHLVWIPTDTRCHHLHCLDIDVVNDFENMQKLFQTNSS